MNPITHKMIYIIDGPDKNKTYVIDKDLETFKTYSSLDPFSRRIPATIDLYRFEDSYVKIGFMIYNNTPVEVFKWTGDSLENPNWKRI